MADHDIKEFKHGGGSLMLFGLPFLLIGSFFVVMFSAMTKVMNTSGDPMVGAIVGGVFALIGAGLVFGRSGTILDRRRRVATTWWGLLVPFKRTEYPLDKAGHVSIKREVRRSKNSTYEVFPVRLKGEGLNLTFGAPQNYDESRRQAEEIAKFLGLGIRDSSAGEEVIREAGTLDESVQARARRLNLATPLPAQPSGAVCTIQYGGPRSTTVIDIPPAGIGLGHLAGLISSLAFSAFVFFMFLGPELQGGFKGDDWFIALFIGVFFMAMPVGGTLLAMLQASKLRYRITVSPTGLEVFQQGIFGTRTTAFPAAEIEEVETTGMKSNDPAAVTEHLLRDSSNLTPKQQEQMRRMAPKIIGAAKFMGQINADAGSVLIRSDRLTWESGSALVRAEKEWLRNIIVHVLTADVTGGSGKGLPPESKPVPAPMPQPVSAVTPVIPTQPPGKVRRSGSGGLAVSLIGVAALIFVLYQNGVFEKFFPKENAESAVPPAVPHTTRARTARTESTKPPIVPDAFAETDKMLKQSLATAEQAYGPYHPAVAVVLYEMGVFYQEHGMPKDQAQAWLRAFAILDMISKKDLNLPYGSSNLEIVGLDPGDLNKPIGNNLGDFKEIVARGLGDFYWDQYQYLDSYNHYDLAYKLAEEVQIDDAERNRRLASSSAGIMATACYLGKWEIADFAMAELKERMKTVSPEEQKRLDYWVRTGEPRLKKRKC